MASSCSSVYFIIFLSFSICTLDKLIYLSARVLVASELMISVGGGEVDQASPLLPLGGWFSGWAGPLLCLRSYLLFCLWLASCYLYVLGSGLSNVAICLSVSYNLSNSHHANIITSGFTKENR